MPLKGFGCSAHSMRAPGTSSSATGPGTGSPVGTRAPARVLCQAAEVLPLVKVTPMRRIEQMGV